MVPKLSFKKTKVQVMIQHDTQRAIILRLDMTFHAGTKLGISPVRSMVKTSHMGYSPSYPIRFRPFLGILTPFID